jgi:hypothetical protein
MQLSYSSTEMEAAGVCEVFVIVYQTNDEATIFRLEEGGGRFLRYFDTIYQVTGRNIARNHNLKE